ncbi:unnamed protein product [Bubo scandiacus]
MATETEQICPICCDTPRDNAYGLPCRHWFGLDFILPWLNLKRECPICRKQVEKVRFPVQEENDYIDVITLPEASRDVSSQAGTAPSHPAKNSPYHPMASPAPSPQGTLSPDEQGTAGPEAQAVGGILPKVWAELFQTDHHLLNPLLPWLRLELWSICGPRWWQARRAEARILQTLCVSGPVAEAMVQVLQPDLGEHAAPLVRGVINIIVDQCSQDARGLLPHHSVWEEDDSSGAGSSSTSPSPTSSRWGTPPSSSTSPSPTSSSGRDRSTGGSRRPPKRRAPSPQDSAQPCKTSPRWQH